MLSQPKPLLPDSTDPNKVAFQAIQFLRSVPPGDRSYVRFLSYYHLEEQPESLKKHVQVMRFWINNLHRESDVEFPKEVPGSASLFWIDLRDYGWNSDAWSSATQNEPYFNEISVNPGYALTLREASGVKQDQKKFRVDSIIRGDWFIRETCEQDRSQAYFDLLFAAERFAGGKKVTVEWKGGEWNGQYLKPGTYYYETSAKKNFPANEQDFEKIFGVDLIRGFIKQTKLNLQHGAVVEGGEMGVSIVSRQNRLIERTAGPIGWYYKTYDVKETTGRRDFAETLQKDFEFDAGEILARLPGGGQAGLLVDSKGTVLTVADNRFANDSSDYRYDTRVRNYGSCVVCHESGIIRPQNLIEQMLKAGIDIRFKDKKEARDARSFFLNWDIKLTHEQEDYSTFLKRTSGFLPGQNSTAFKEVRELYDSPVDLAKAAREAGISPNGFELIAAKSTKARLTNLVRGIKMPRRTWEVDGYSEWMKLRSVK